ncbi:hypothetical protein H4Q26_017020 [Puccinia striiformis f. sp. tritici PST-130]|nr:hypothetical protein H4Q26_017020 [Puccinia striiformis f. sp. tritici PST-130]
MDPVYSQPRSRSSSQGSSSGQSVILNTPLPRLPEIGYELPYDDLHPSELGRQRQVPPHRSLPAPTYEVVSNPILPDGAPCLVVRLKGPPVEFFGTAILALFGTAANCQVALSNSNLVTSSPAGTYLSVAIQRSRVLATMRILVRSFPLRRPVYWLAQISGAVAGSGLELLERLESFRRGHGVRNIEKTGGLFFTSALPYASNYLCFYNEVLMTAILMIFVVAVGDQGNTSPPKNMGPFVIFWVVLGLASTLGMQTSFALNPARDLGPRIVTWLAGYGSAVWSVRSNYWFSVAILGPGFGAIVGCFIYDFFIATEKVTDCALHQPRDIGALMKKFRDITPIKDPEQTNLTKFVRQRPSRLEFPTGRRAPAAMNEDSVTGSARTTSHRYTNLTRG